MRRCSIEQRSNVFFYNAARNNISLFIIVFVSVRAKAGIEKKHSHLFDKLTTRTFVFVANVAAGYLCVCVLIFIRGGFCICKYIKHSAYNNRCFDSICNFILISMRLKLTAQFFSCPCMFDMCLCHNTTWCGTCEYEQASIKLRIVRKKKAWNISCNQFVYIFICCCGFILVCMWYSWWLSYWYIEFYHIIVCDLLLFY